MSECWTRQSTHTKKLAVTETRMLRWSGGVSLLDKVRNRHLLGSFKVNETIEAKLDERQIRWYGHVLRRPDDHVTKKVMAIPETFARQPGRPKDTWMKTAKKKAEAVNLPAEIATERRIWNLRSRAHQSNAHPSSSL